MGLIPEHVIIEIADRADILRTVGAYVSLKRAGSVHKGLCPFHQEKTPSFIVTPSRGTYKCFGCGAAGSVFRFLMEMEGLHFPEAVRKIAAEVGVEVPETGGTADPSEREARQKKRDAYLEVLALAHSWFVDNLWREANSSEQEYLIARGVDEETARTFGLGHAPDTWTGLVDHMARFKVNGETCEAAGLATMGKHGFNDRFRGRIIFPIFDRWGKTVAFGGRILDPDAKAPKYLNSPETPFYTKGSEVFGLATTKQEIRREDAAVIVEGNFDVIVLYAQGVKNVVAPMGTALTEKQARLLGRFTKRVFVSFDGDRAGIAATHRSLPILLAQNFDARVIQMPSGDDPDSYIRREGLESYGAQLRKAKPIVAWALQGIFDPAEGASVEDRVQALKEAAEVLSHVREPVTWRHYATEIARRLDLNPAEIDIYLKRPSALETSGTVTRTAAGAIPPLEAAFIQAVVLTPDSFDELAGQGNYQQLFTDERVVYLIERAHAYRNLHPDRVPPLAVLAELVAESGGDMEFTAQVTSLVEDAAGKYPPDRHHQVWGDTVTRLQLKWLQREQEATNRLIQTVEPGSDAYLNVIHRLKSLDEARARLDIRLGRKRM
jgi:DNA primase